MGDEVVLIGRQGSGGRTPLTKSPRKMGTLACVPPTLITKECPGSILTEFRGAESLNLICGIISFVFFFKA